MSHRSILWFALLLIGFIANAAWAQGNIQQNENLPTLPPMMRESPNHSNIFVDSDPNQKVLAAQAAIARLQSIKRDSEKLCLLSAKLKDQMDKNGGNVLSADAVKMVQQIEKLAHGLKQKMKD